MKEEKAVNGQIIYQKEKQLKFTALPKRKKSTTHLH